MAPPRIAPDDAARTAIRRAWSFVERGVVAHQAGALVRRQFVIEYRIRAMLAPHLVGQREFTRRERALDRGVRLRTAHGFDLAGAPSDLGIAPDGHHSAYKSLALGTGWPPIAVASVWFIERHRRGAVPVPRIISVAGSLGLRSFESNGNFVS
jgi:hypothetical protein